MALLLLRFPFLVYNIHRQALVYLRTHTDSYCDKNHETHPMTFINLQVSNSVEAKFYFSMFGDTRSILPWVCGCLGLPRMRLLILTKNDFNARDKSIFVVSQTIIQAVYMSLFYQYASPIQAFSFLIYSNLSVLASLKMSRLNRRLPASMKFSIHG